MYPSFQELKNEILHGRRLSPAEAVELFEQGWKRPFVLMAAASEIREYYKGKKINLCGIINAKSGKCREDCKFCAQSGHWLTNASFYPLLPAEEMIQKADMAAASGARFFGIVTSGTRISSDGEWNTIFRVIAQIGKSNIKPCASLGMIDFSKALELRKAGLFRYHHNLETSRSFFDEICTTHPYDSDIETVLAAKKAGLSTCSGGIIGLGETIEQRIELACTLRDLDVDSVPINILSPIPGTPLENRFPLSPMEILLTIAVFRFILPDKDIRLCGGKEKNLKQLLPLGIVAGANSLMTGNYLTTTGRDANLDQEMIRDLGLDIY
jgi:biotin synthase